MRATAAQEPLPRIRRLYDAWNAGDVATAAQVLSPKVEWDTFGAATGEMQATRAAGSVGIDLLVGVGEHVLAFSGRSGAEPDRIEIWTVRDGRAVHYRGYPLDEGLAVLNATTRSRKLELMCRAVLAFNRGDRERWAGYFDGEGRRFARRLEGRRLDDVQILGEALTTLVVSATYHHEAVTTVYLAISFGDDRLQRVVVHATAEAALAG